MNTFNV
jgi:hypothetical protein